MLLKCLLLLDCNILAWKSQSLICCSNLQQLYIPFSVCTSLSNDFMSSISVRGGLVHVVLKVGSEGISVLVRNSPMLLTFHAVFNTGIFDKDGTKVEPEFLNFQLKQEFSCRPLFLMGSCLIISGVADSEFKDAEWERRFNADLYSLWVNNEPFKHYTVKVRVLF